MVVSTLFYWSSTVFNVIVKSTLTVFKPEPIQLWSSLVADFQWLLGAIYFPMPMKSESSPIRYIDPQDWYQRCNNQNTVGVRKWVKNWRRWPIETVCLPQDVGGSKMGVSYQSILGVSLSHTGHMDGEVLAAGASRPWKSFVCSDTHICPLSMISIRGGGWKIVYLFTLGPLPLSAAAAFTFNFTLRSGHSLCRCTWTPFYLPEMKMAKISCIFHFLTFESLRLVQVFTVARIASTLSLLLSLLGLSFNSQTQSSVFLTITCVVDSEMNKFVWKWDTISGFSIFFFKPSLCWFSIAGGRVCTIM